MDNFSLGITGNEKDVLKADLSTPALSIPAGQMAKIPYRIYMGPKKTENLRDLGSSAEKLIDFGFFTVVAKPLLWVLNITHGVTKNFGIDIILLSFLIKIIFLPLPLFIIRQWRILTL